MVLIVIDGSLINLALLGLDIFGLEHSNVIANLIAILFIQSSLSNLNHTWLLFKNIESSDYLIGTWTYIRGGSIG